MAPQATFPSYFHGKSINPNGEIAVQTNLSENEQFSLTFVLTAFARLTALLANRTLPGRGGSAAKPITFFPLLPFY